MSKIRKTSNHSLNKFCAAYFYDMTMYAQSRNKIYDEFENKVYDIVYEAAKSGKYTTTVPLKLNESLSFDWNMEHYKDIFDNLAKNFVDRGFTVKKVRNYFTVSWGSRNEGKKK